MDHKKDRKPAEDQRNAEPHPPLQRTGEVPTQPVGPNNQQNPRTPASPLPSIRRQ